MAWVLKMDDATIESGLVHDFDASLSGIGQELGAGAYSMRSEPTWSRRESGTLRSNVFQLLFVLAVIVFVSFVWGSGMGKSCIGDYDIVLRIP